MIDFSKPIRTMNGDPVRILATDIACPNYPILAAVKSHATGLEDTVRYTREGKLSFVTTGRYSPHHRDLENVPEQRVRYLNVYSDGYIGKGYASAGTARSKADSAASRTGRTFRTYKVVTTGTLVVSCEEA